MSNAVDITVRIDQVVLEGVPAADWRRIEDALRRELERLVGQQDIPDTHALSRRIASVDAGDLGGHAGLLPDEIGRRLAQVVYDELISR